jgi:hypothetical protein
MSSGDQSQNSGNTDSRRPLTGSILPRRFGSTGDRPKLSAPTTVDSAAETPPEAAAPEQSRRRRSYDNPDPYRDHPDWPGDLRNVQVRLPESLLRALKHLAVDQDTTVSRIICRACYGSFQVPPTWTSSRSEDRLEDWERHRDVA